MGLIIKLPFFKKDIKIQEMMPDIRPFLYPVSGRISGFICRISGWPAKLLAGYPAKSVSGTTLEMIHIDIEKNEENKIKLTLIKSEEKVSVRWKIKKK